MLLAVTLTVLQLGAVHHVGEMRKVMREGDLTNTFTFSGLTSTQSVYGIGPLDGLTGEIVLVNGKSFVSTVRGGQPVVEARSDFKAPFFVWSTVPVWREVRTKDVRNLQGLEEVLNKLGKPGKPFAFRVTGSAKAKYHIVDRPSDAKEFDHDAIKKHFEVGARSS